MAIFKGFMLPGGRGPLYGANAQSLVGEQARSRQSELPTADPFCISTLPFYANLTAQAVGSTSENYFAFAGNIDHVTTVSHVRMRCTTAAGGSTMHTQLYFCDFRHNTVPTLIAVPDTHADFDISSATLRTVALPRPVSLMPHAHYVLGWRCSSAVARFAGLGATVSRVLSVLVQANATDLPEQIALARLAKSYLTPVPQIVYMPTIAAELF